MNSIKILATGMYLPKEKIDNKKKDKIQNEIKKQKTNKIKENALV